MSLASRVDPARNAIAVSPSDTIALASPSRALYVGGSGNVAVILAEDGANPVTFAGVLAGTLLPIAVTQVMNTGTTATLILSLR